MSEEGIAMGSEREPLSGILCKMLGHKRRTGWWGDGLYGDVQATGHDGINRKHYVVKLECDRCGKNYIAARFHGQQIKDDHPTVQAFREHRIAAEARGVEKAAKIAEHAWFTCAIDVIMDADAAQALCETTAAAIRAALNGGQHE